jgi:two-component system response regulator
MSKTPSPASQVRVLVVEDNADDRELLLRQLRKTGMADQEALLFLTASDQQPADEDLIAIFLDLNLPSLSGLDLLRLLRQNETLQDTPVIVMTSSNNPRDLEECRRLRVTQYVSKPVTFTSFSKAVADVFHLPRNADSPVAEI